MRAWILLLSLLALAACSKGGDRLQPVPLGETAALQRLADAYTSLSADHRFSPSALAPKAKKQFVLHVFEKAGFNYHKTLLELAQGKTFDAGIENHRELAKLVLFAHHGQFDVDPASLYDAQELPLIRQLEKRLE